MSITIWTTTSCNLKCAYCYEMKSNQISSSSKEQKLNPYDVIEWINKNNLGKDRICFHGGEPLMNFKLIKAIADNLQIQDKLPKRMGFTTNGMVWSTEIETFLTKYKRIFDYDVSISMDGIEKIHNMHRETINGKDSYNKVLETQKKLITIFPEMRARMTITPENVEFFNENIQHLADLGFQNIAASVDYFNRHWSEETIKQLENELIKVIDFWKKNQELCLPFINDIRFRKPRGYCSFSYNIYPDGNIYPCIGVAGMEDFCVGNLKEGLAKEKIKSLQAAMRSDYELCKECSYKSYCVHNRCKLVNYSTVGEKNTPNALGCRIENLKFDIEKKLADFINYSNDISSY